VRAKTYTVLWVVDRSHFKAILAKAAEAHLLQYAKHLHAIERMEKLPKKVRLEVANALQEIHYDQGDCVYNYGDRGDTFFLFFKGELGIVKGGKEQETLIGDSKHPAIFGEKALSESLPYKETVVVKSAMAIGFCMNSATFTLLMDKVNIDKENKKKT